jgi:hypothetical protein
MALVAEVVHGSTYRFTDPSRFSLAHGGKDGHPFPVPQNRESSLENREPHRDKGNLIRQSRGGAMRLTPYNAIGSH